MARLLLAVVCRKYKVRSWAGGLKTKIEVLLKHLSERITYGAALELKD